MNKYYLKLNNSKNIKNKNIVKNQKNKKINVVEKKTKCPFQIILLEVTVELIEAVERKSIFERIYFVKIFLKLLTVNDFFEIFFYF